MGDIEFEPQDIVIAGQFRMFNFADQCDVLATVWLVCRHRGSIEAEMWLDVSLFLPFTNHLSNLSRWSNIIFSSNILLNNVLSSQRPANGKPAGLCFFSSSYYT